MQGFPIIYRVAPELSFGTEIIRRHTGHESRPQIGTELEPLGISPDIAGIQRHEEREIADKQHPAVTGILLQGAPLARQQELRKPTLVDLIHQLAARARHGRRISPEQVLRPIEEIRASQVRLQARKRA
jgi:hypothetical protein